MEMRKIFKNVKVGQKYVVICTQSVSRSKVGLGSKGTFSRDSFVTYNGSPTIDPNDPKRPAQVYIRGKEDFPFDYEQLTGGGFMMDYFSPVPVNVRIELL